ncbi:MAG: DNA-binding domain-containing protein [Blastomonas sp.]|nr:DNA-binding domain-containing protein [Blastomonas sp.]
MTSLEDDQARIVAVLQRGPSAFPDGLFAGDADRALLGLKAHANTISHARLVALEQTFPRTLAHIGPEAFNALSRDFIDLPEVRRCKLMGIGEGFADHLEHNASDPLAAGLARIEWAWLQSYHAADTAALELADLAQFDEAGLLAMPVTVHTAMRIVPVASAVAEMLPELASGDVPAAGILVTRPQATVRLHPLTRTQAGIAASAKNCATFGNLLQFAVETQGEAEALPAVFALIEAGALASPGG